MEKMQHFSIRKLSVGAASILIGLSFLKVKESTVKADSLQSPSKTELTKSNAANEVIEQEPASKADAKQITNDWPKIFKQIYHNIHNNNVNF